MNVPFADDLAARCFGGVLGFYQHPSRVNDCDMRFAVFTPPQAERGQVPVLYYLAGLTCTEETFVIKAGAQRRAASSASCSSRRTPARAVPLPGDRDPGISASAPGFYLDATAGAVVEALPHVQLRDVEELPALIEREFPGRHPRAAASSAIRWAGTAR